MEHHYKEPNLGFGVTSPVWDWVFGECFFFPSFLVVCEREGKSVLLTARLRATLQIPSSFRRRGIRRLGLRSRGLEPWCGRCGRVETMMTEG